MGHWVEGVLRPVSFSISWRKRMENNVQAWLKLPVTFRVHTSCPWRSNAGHKMSQQNNTDNCQLRGHLIHSDGIEWWLQGYSIKWFTCLYVCFVCSVVLCGKFAMQLNLMSQLRNPFWMTPPQPTGTLLRSKYIHTRKKGGGGQIREILNNKWKTFSETAKLLWWLLWWHTLSSQIYCVWIS